MGRAVDRVLWTPLRPTDLTPEFRERLWHAPAVSVTKITGERSRTTPSRPAATVETPFSPEMNVSGPDAHLI